MRALLLSLSLLACLPSCEVCECDDVVLVDVTDGVHGSAVSHVVVPSDRPTSLVVALRAGSDLSATIRALTFVSEPKGALELTPTALLSGTTTIMAGEPLRLQVARSPSHSAGVPAHATLTLEVDRARSPIVVTFDLAGPAPRLAVESSTGEPCVDVGEIYETPVTLHNVGEAPLTVDRIEAESSPGFTLRVGSQAIDLGSFQSSLDTPLVIAAGASVDATLVYSAAEVRPARVSLRVRSDDPDDLAEGRERGFAVNVACFPDASTLDFGVVPLGGEKTATVQLSPRQSFFLLDQLAFSVPPGDALAFTIDPTLLAQLPLVARASVAVAVTFRPLHSGVSHAELELRSGEVSTMTGLSGSGE